MVLTEKPRSTNMGASIAPYVVKNNYSVKKCQTRIVSIEKYLRLHLTKTSVMNNILHKCPYL